MSVCIIKTRSLPRRHGSRLHRILFRPLAIAAGEVPKSRAALKLKLITARWKRVNILCAIINIKAWKEQFDVQYNIPDETILLVDLINV